MPRHVSISVAMCTRNGARFIADQIGSILAQTMLPAEVVLSDDASTDETVEVARVAFKAHNGAHPDHRVRLIVMQNADVLGVTRNFEQAITRCSGDYIALADQDDVWHIDHVATLVAALESRPGLLAVGSDARLVDAQGEKLTHSLFEALQISRFELRAVTVGSGFETLLRRNLMTGATMMIRRTLLDSALPFPSSWVHDEWLACIAAAVGEVSLLGDRLTDYRQHGTNQIGAKRLSFSGKVGRLSIPREERNRRLAARASDLQDRLKALGPKVPVQFVEQARKKLDHELVRLRLPRDRWRRIGPVVAEYRRGGYRWYGRGWRDVLRDLVQPVD